MRGLDAKSIAAGMGLGVLAMAAIGAAAPSTPRAKLEAEQGCPWRVAAAATPADRTLGG